MTAPAAVRQDEVRRAELAVDAVCRAESPRELLDITLDALDEHLGFHGCAFMLALSGAGRPYTGAQHGYPEYCLEEYFERWVDVDALASQPGLVSYEQSGFADMHSLYRSLDGARRRFVDDFLRRIRAQGQLSFRVAGVGSDGYLTLQRAGEFTARERELLQEAVVPRVTAHMRALLPRGIDGVLSHREAQVAELVALGFTNREIASVIHVEEDTVKKHVSGAMRGLGVDSRVRLAVSWATGSVADVTPGAAQL